MSTSITQNSQVVQQSTISAEMQDMAKKIQLSDYKLIRSTPLQENTNNIKPVEGAASSLGVKKSPEGPQLFGEGFQPFAGEMKLFGLVKGNYSKLLFEHSARRRIWISDPPYEAFINSKINFDGSSTTYQYNTITCSPIYRNVSIEELRLQDYQQGKNLRGKTILYKAETDQKGKYSEKESDEKNGKEEEEEEVKKEKAENETVAAQDTKTKTSIGKAIESAPKEQETALSISATTKEPFLFGNTTQGQANTFLFTFRTTFGSGSSTDPVTKKAKFRGATIFKPEAGISSITNEFAGLAISSTTSSTKKRSTADPTMTSKDHLYACNEGMMKSQVKEEVQNLFKEGKLDDELRKIVKQELLKLIGDIMKKP